MPNNYNDTLNLPKTDFPMRAGLPAREPNTLEKWNKNDMYGKLMQKNSEKPTFILHDGPPFSNGNVHMGHAMNKILKDFVNRYKSMSGYCTPYVPGWDNHGMPIESAIIKKNKLDRKKMSVTEFRNACHDFAENFVNIQREQFMRLGVIADWQHPYLTMDPAFEAEEVKVFGEMYKKNYIYKGLKPVYWCPHDETALAEAEIEYQDDKCESIYVKFRVTDDKGKFSELCDINKLFFVIWTTTTWSLPGNLAIALHPNAEYVLAHAANGETYIVAHELLERTMSFAKIDEYEILASFTGKEMEFAHARHPFLDRDSVVVLADYVTMDSGTGCVHTAPCHGMDDYITGLRYKLPGMTPIDDKGYMTAEAGKFEGLYYEKGAEAILEELKQNGTLFASETLLHSYPHCWRCKHPVIYRATDQWFCSVDAIKDDAIKACAEATWIPAWGEERIMSMIRDRTDWCISRQRHWGLPIPVFYCADCGKPICTSESIAVVSKLFGEEGSNAWYLKDASEILPNGFVCPHCGANTFTKETDTLDGWFDSGSTHFASLEKSNASHWPADLYLEGADQYRGWFQSSLLTAVATKGTAPYKTVLTHGWVVDGAGKAMHKSLGNGMAPDEIIKQYGADILRLWVASSDYRVDVRVSDNIVKQLSQAYLKIRNTARYILGNLEGFSPDADSVPYAKLSELDQWALGKLNGLTAKVAKAYEDYEYHIVFHSIHNFCVLDMSNFYLDVIKDRLYCDKTDGEARRAAQTTMFIILDALVKMLTPILAFTADEIWSFMPHRNADDAESPLFNDMPKFAEEYDNRLVADKWDKILELRDITKKAMEVAKTGKSLEVTVTLRCPASEYEFATSVKELLPVAFICSAVEIEKTQTETVEAIISPAEGGKCERCWTVNTTVGTDADHPTLCARCAATVR